MPLLDNGSYHGIHPYQLGLLHMKSLITPASKAVHSARTPIDSGMHGYKTGNARAFSHICEKLLAVFLNRSTTENTKAWLVRKRIAH